MQIKAIDVKNYLGIGSLDLLNTKKVLLVAGHNGAGKSSLAEAIRHALLGKFRRVEFKKDLHSLLHGDADAGHVILETDLGGFGAILPGGDVTGDHSLLNYALPLCLEPETFASYDESERRKFLFKLMGVKITSAEIESRLIERKANALKVNEILPYLSGGFDAAAKKAAENAKESKTAWRVLTGETYGEKKAEGWKKTMSDAPSTIIEQEDLAAADLEVEKLVGLVADAKARHTSSVNIKNNMASRQTRIEALREHAGKYARIQEKLNRDEKDLAAWELKVTAEQSRIDPSTSDRYACPDCGSVLCFDGGQLIPHQDVEAVESLGNIEELIKARDLMKSAVENGKRDLSAADNAANNLAALENEVVGEYTEPEVLAQERQQFEASLEAKRAHRDAIRHDYQKLQATKNAAEESKIINNRAAAYHKDVSEWDFIAEALEPDGIQAEMLEEAIAPFNEKLVAMSDESQWPLVQVDADMNIAVGDQWYELISESEQWRADAVIAAAIAIISGIKMIMLDRFDVLDLTGRGQLFNWLANVELHQAVVLGTMKAKPAGMPAYINPIWLGE